jgi:hypothetical protein
LEKRDAGRVFGGVAGAHDRVCLPLPVALIDDVLIDSQLVAVIDAL